MNPLQGVLAVIGRVLLCTIFVLAAVGNKIPHFGAVAQLMASKGMPMPELMLVGAIAFLLVGSVSVIVGCHARIGALLLLVFLVLATYYFHDFWNVSDPKEKMNQMNNFLKNVSMMGAMLLIIAAGPGPMSLDARRAKAHRV